MSVELGFSGSCQRFFLEKWNHFVCLQKNFLSPLENKTNLMSLDLGSSNYSLKKSYYTESKMPKNQQKSLCASFDFE